MEEAEGAHGLSLNDHKAATQHPGMAKNDTLFRHIPYKHGFSPARYQQITNFQIIKKSDIYYRGPHAHHPVNGGGL
jgi:hypothetical protein